MPDVPAADAAAPAHPDAPATGIVGARRGEPVDADDLAADAVLRAVTRELARRLGGTRAWLVRADALAALLDRLAADGPLRRVSVLDERNDVADLRALGTSCREPAERAKAAGERGFDPARLNELLVADVSAVSCAGCAPVQLGAHLAVDDLSLVWDAEPERGPAIWPRDPSEDAG